MLISKKASVSVFTAAVWCVPALRVAFSLELAARCCTPYASQMVAVYDVVEIAGISQMYDSIQAVLTSQLRYRALWNESTAAKTVMSYQSRIVPRQRTVLGVDGPWSQGRDRAEITRASIGRLGP